MTDNFQDAAARRHSFESLVMPHLDAAYNLARWLTRNDADAEDVVQDASIKAFRFLHQCKAEDARGWFLTIVRNAAYTWLRNKRPQELVVSLGGDGDLADLAVDPETPESRYIDQQTSRRLNEAIEKLPIVYREVVILREQEELSYKAMAEVIGVPIGTIMSRLARGRVLLAKALGKPLPGLEPQSEVL